MLLLLYAVFALSEFKISHLNALLRFKDPNSDRLPHFTLSAEGGCMNWTSLNPNIVKVTPIYDSRRCSKSALVEVVTTGPNRKSTSIFVEDSTGQNLKCDVFVDSVASVSILTTTRSIFIESSLETLYLQALDSGKNIFTSLEGTNIDWKIDTEHLRIIDPSKAKVTTQSASSVSHPKSSAQLIIQGTKVGKTWASATLDNNLRSEVELTVVEPIALFPQPVVRVLPYTHIPYKLCSTRGLYENEGERQCVSQIHLPSESNYRIETSNQQVITTDQAAYVTVNEVGMATVTAIDQHMTDNTASSLVIVSYPSRVIQDEQYIALGDTPKFNPILFDKDNKNYNYFEEVNWEIKGDWSTVGRKEVTLKYHDFTFIAIVHVCPPLSIVPERALLPINYNGFPLTVSGGSGDYTYKIESPTILNYQNGHVNTLNYGKSRIIFNDKRIPRFSISAEIEVSRIGLIDIQLEYRETIDRPFQPVCEVFATEKRKFSVDVPFKVKSSNVNVVSGNMFPVSTGFSDIYCESGESQSEHLKVSVATNLKAEVDGIASPNSIVPLKISGGVLKWPLSDEDPAITINCPGSNSHIYDNYKFTIDHEFTGLCTLSMQNKQSSQNPHPLLVETKFEVKFHKVDRFTMHFIDLTNQNLMDSRCNFPPFKVIDPRSAKENYNITLNHQYKIYIYAIDANNELIKYYSADRFTLQSSSSQEIIQVNRQRDFDSDLSTQYLITPNQATKLTIIPSVNPNTKSNSLILNQVSDFSVKGSNLYYFQNGKSYEYSIEGGSGIFETRQPSAYFRDSKIYFNPSSPGNYKIDIKDVCNPNYVKNVDVELISVASLHIDAPSIVAFNSEFEAIVKAYDKDGRLISPSMNNEANIRISNVNAEKLSYNTWRINASTNDKITITATAENGVSASHIVDVVKSIIVSPQYIELLPGETQHVTVISGPSNINFDDGRSKIASFNSQTYDVVAVSPGNVVINVTANDINDLPPFPIYVHVIRPIDLTITPSSDHVVQYGKLMLNVVMNTDKGIRTINNAKWTVPNDFLYDMINNSLIVVHCNEPKNLVVGVSAYGLSSSFSITVEPKLRLLSPQEIYLPTHCSYRILIENDLDCQFSSIDSSIISIDPSGKGLILSNQTEGDAIVIVRFGHQFLTVNIKVSNPKQFYISQVQPITLDYNFTLLNPEGYEYTTTQCLNYDLYVKDSESNDIHIAKETKTHNGQIFSVTSQRISLDHPLEVVATVSNQVFTLKNTYFIASSNAITPPKPIFLKGYGKQMKCTVQNPNWVIQDTSIASVSSQGFVSAKNVGQTQLSCANGVSTVIKVLDIKGIKIEPEMSNHDDTVNYRIDFILSDSSLMNSQSNVIKPDDYDLSCDLDISSRSIGCGTVSHVTKNGNDYCVFTPNENVICPQNSKLIATVNSRSLGIHIKGESLIPRQSTSNLGSSNINSFSNTQTRVSVSREQRTIEVPVNMRAESTDIQASYGLSANFDEYGGVVVITAEDNFGPKGSVVLRDKITNEKFIIEVYGDLKSNKRRSLYKDRGLSFYGNETYFITMLFLIIGIVYLIIMLL
ncbi:hypothetical protein M9Y10_005453 [Tritrichomonas musculus]|uniref:BIG2 domain-containing protein n=1 Tax=Tritrichomonas musculus TaxID=1915356 RepID=A0ABR2JLZ5_9EUKA